MSLASLLRRSDPSRTLARPAPHQAAWLTGRSSATSTRLSPEQIEVLELVRNVGFSTLAVNFPWNEDTAGDPWRDVPLLPASLRNGCQFLTGSLSSRFRREIARFLQPVVEATHEHLLLLCGSSGLQLFSWALPHLAIPPGLRIRAVALGPVCPRPARHSALDIKVVRGRRDPWSRLGCPLEPNRTVDTDHLGYAGHPDVRAYVVEEARRLLVDGISTENRPGAP